METIEADMAVVVEVSVVINAGLATGKTGFRSLLIHKSQHKTAKAVYTQYTFKAHSCPQRIMGSVVYSSKFPPALKLQC